jgi:hypothetical protein
MQQGSKGLHICKLTIRHKKITGFHPGAIPSATYFSSSYNLLSRNKYGVNKAGYMFLFSNISPPSYPVTAFYCFQKLMQIIHVCW